jgi:hypothetical protein
VRDAEQPAGEPAGRVEGRQVPERLDERLLREILGQGGIGRDPRDEPDDRPLIATDDVLYGGLRAGQRLGNQPGFGDRLEVNRYEFAPL